MKRKFLKSAFLVAVMAFSCYGIGKGNPSFDSEAQLLISNVEALSQNESPTRYVKLELEQEEEETYYEEAEYSDGTIIRVEKTRKVTRTVTICIVSENGPLTFC